MSSALGLVNFMISLVQGVKNAILYIDIVISSISQNRVRLGVTIN